MESKLLKNHYAKLFHHYAHFPLQYRRHSYIYRLCPNNERPLEEKTKCKYHDLHYLDLNNFYYITLRNFYSQKSCVQYRNKFTTFSMSHSFSPSYKVKNANKFEIKEDLW